MATIAGREVSAAALIPAKGLATSNDDYKNRIRIVRDA